MIDTNHGSGLYGEAAEVDQLWSALEMLSAESLAHVEESAEENVQAEHQALAVGAVATAAVEEFPTPCVEALSADATEHQQEETIAAESEPAAVAAAVEGIPTVEPERLPAVATEEQPDALAAPVGEISTPEAEALPTGATEHQPEETIAAESEPLAIAAAVEGCGKSLVDTERTGGDACPTPSPLEAEPVAVATAVAESLTDHQPEQTIAVASAVEGCGRSSIDTQRTGEDARPTATTLEAEPAAVAAALLSEALLVLAEESLPPAKDEIAVPSTQPYVLADRLSPINLPSPVPGRTVIPVGPAGGLAIPGLVAREFPIPEFPALPPVYSSRKAGLPSWALTMVAAVVVTLVIASLIQKLSSSQPATSAAAPPLAKHAAVPTRTNREAVKASAPAPEPVQEAAPVAEAQEAPTPKVEPATPVPTPANEYPYARFVEVTALKVVQENNRPQVQYFVVNRAERELDDIALRINVRSSTAAQGAGPLFSVMAWVPKLAPHQSKEIRTDLDTGLTAAQIPKPANLRAEVRVTSQQ